MKQIIFKEIEIQHFLSVGEEPVRIEFHPGFHIITGINRDKQDRRNGIGKSTISCGIYFAIFGTTLRELKKELIPNNITNGQCKVELSFDVITEQTRDNYKIVRTLSPTKCYIYKNGDDITRDSIGNNTNYIQNLINCTGDVFQNTVIMTVNNTIPFMAKKKVEKRKFIEGIFNLEVFSEMISNLRADYNDTKKYFDIESTAYTEINNSLTNYKNQHENVLEDRRSKLEKYLKRQETNKSDIKKLESNIVTVSEDMIQSNNEIISTLEAKIPELSEKRDKCLKHVTIFETKTTELKKRLKSIGNELGQECPVCLHVSDVDDIHVIETEKQSIQSKITENNTTIDKLELTVKTIETNINKVNTTIKNIIDKNTKITKQISNQKLIQEKIKQLTEWQEQLKTDINELKTTDTGVEKYIDEYTERLTSSKNTLESIKNKLNMLDVVKYVVSEEGVKSYIVKKMLALFNSRLAYYLKKMDSNCICIFNEYFEEQIINEKGKICSYFNFSGAERKNIDLACLFAFMDIRRLQGDVTFNISLYDELFDSSLDERGVDLVTNILKERVDQYKECVMVISHRKESVKAATGDVIFLEKLNGVTRKINPPE